MPSSRERVAEYYATYSGMELARRLVIAEARVDGAKLYVDQADARIRMLEEVATTLDGILGERDRYRLAWTSARRRAAYADSMATEAVSRYAAEIARLRAELEASRSDVEKAPQVD